VCFHITPYRYIEEQINFNFYSFIKIKKVIMATVSMSQDDLNKLFENSASITKPNEEVTPVVVTEEPVKKATKTVNVAAGFTPEQKEAMKAVVMKSGVAIYKGGDATNTDESQAKMAKELVEFMKSEGYKFDESKKLDYVKWARSGLVSTATSKLREIGNTVDLSTVTVDELSAKLDSLESVSYTSKVKNVEKQKTVLLAPEVKQNYIKSFKVKYLVFPAMPKKVGVAKPTQDLFGAASNILDEI
jgi:hypothetical protein